MVTQMLFTTELIYAFMQLQLESKTPLAVLKTENYRIIKVRRSQNKNLFWLNKNQLKS